VRIDTNLTLQVDDSLLGTRLLPQQTEAMTQFTYRMAVVDPPEEGTGMADNFNVLPLAPTNFPVCNSADVCVMMATFWNCVLVLRQTPQWELEGTVLALPGVSGVDDTQEVLERFDAIMDLMRRILKNTVTIPTSRWNWCTIIPTTTVPQLKHPPMKYGRGICHPGTG